MMNAPTIALTADFAVLEEPKISNTAMTAGCASTEVCTQTIIAKAESTNPTVLYARNSSSAPEVPRMKCLVDMRSTGNASDNWLLTILVVLFARRQPKHGNA